MNAPAASTLRSSDLAVGWTQRAAVAVARRIARGACALEVRGLEHLPADEPCLLCANHSSHADTFALAAAVGGHARRLVFLAARDYFSRFRYRTWFVRRLICLLPFERGSGLGAAKHNLRVLGACRDAGRIIVLFPEGTRSRDGVMRPFKPGVAMFADRLGLRVVPCRIEGSHAVLPKGRVWPRPHPLRLTFGAPRALPPAVATGGGDRAVRYARFTAELHETIAGLGEPAARREAALTP